MKTLAIAVVAASMTTLPAIAQQGTNQNSSQSQQTSAQQSDQRQTAMSQQKLRKSLQNAGFKEVNIVDAAYVVHAKTDEGNMVVMYIDPPSGVTGSTSSNTGSAGNTNAASGSKSSK